MAGNLEHYFKIISGDSDPTKLIVVKEKARRDTNSGSENEKDVNAGDQSDQGDSLVIDENQYNDSKEEKQDTKCDTNGAAGRNENSEDVHENAIAAKRKLYKYQCRRCFTGFPNKQRLQDHSDKHIIYAHNECHLCRKVFMRADHLRRHDAAHHTRTPFLDADTFYCLSCPKVYSRQDKLNTHMKTCALSELICCVCSEKFYTAEELKTHRRLTHGLHGYHCGFCTESFYAHSELTSHMSLCDARKNAIATQPPKRPPVDSSASRLKTRKLDGNSVDESKPVEDVSLVPDDGRQASNAGEVTENPGKLRKYKNYEDFLKSLMHFD